MAILQARRGRNGLRAGGLAELRRRGGALEGIVKSSANTIVIYLKLAIGLK